MGRMSQWGGGVGRVLHRNPGYDAGNMLAFTAIGEVQVTEDLVCINTLG